MSVRGAQSEAVPLAVVGPRWLLPEPKPRKSLRSECGTYEIRLEPPFVTVTVVGGYQAIPSDD